MFFLLFCSFLWIVLQIFDGRIHIPKSPVSNLNIPVSLVIVSSLTDFLKISFIFITAPFTINGGKNFFLMSQLCSDQFGLE